MKRVAVLMTLGVVLLAGCGSGGIEFNGVRQVEQFPIRKTPIVHYNLPSEVIDPITGNADVDVAAFNSINLQVTDFVEQATPGHDLWAMAMMDLCTDNPTCPVAPVEDWTYTLTSYKTPGPSWPDPTVTGTGINPILYIAAWTLSLQHQWFLREVNGSAIVPAVVGQPPVRYESVEFSSMAISIIEGAQIVTPFSPLYTNLGVSAQQEAIPAGPAGTGSNGVEQIIVPATNVIDYGYNGLGAPQGLLAVSWQEAPAENKHIEMSIGSLQGVPVPCYFGGGGTIQAGGGVYHKRFSDNWQQTTSGTNSTIDFDDGVNYSYYLACVGNHLIGYGIGLIDSAYALPGAVNNQEDIMNLSVVLDMTAFIAAGKEFQFVVEDLLRMQDTVNGDFMNPGILSTLPGTYR
ncbi:MAG: hypothetical protein H6839_05545 [Planctomycetes bacterium]|nr:hypothetical protein [Planctomycetota bacterium]